MVYVYIHMEYYSVIKRNELLIHTTIWMNLWNYTDWKKPILKGYILYDSTNRKFLKWQNFRNGGQISHCQGFRIGKELDMLWKENTRYPCVDGTACSGSWLWWWTHKPTHRLKLNRTKHTHTDSLYFFYSHSKSWDLIKLSFSQHAIKPNHRVLYKL